MHVYQSITLYTLNIYNCTCQSHHNKAGGGGGGGHVCPLQFPCSVEFPGLPWTRLQCGLWKDNYSLTDTGPDLVTQDSRAWRPPSVFGCPLVGLTGALKHIRLSKPALCSPCPHPGSALRARALGATGSSSQSPAQALLPNGSWQGGPILFVLPRASVFLGNCLGFLCSLREWGGKRNWTQS